MTKFLIIFLLAVVTSCGRSPEGQSSATQPPKRKPIVTITKAVTHEIEYTINAVGSIDASEEINIPARVAGLIDDVKFKEGDKVNVKTTLVEIEIEKFHLAQQRAEADHQRALAQAEAAHTVYNNRLNLYIEGKKQNKEWVTEEQMAIWRADLVKSIADLERARIDVELAKRNYRDAHVKSPIAGIINKKLVSKGEYVRAETVVATILNVDKLYLKFTVPEQEASLLKPDHEILFTLRSTPDISFKSKLFHMNQKADSATRSVECKAEILEKNENFRAGYFTSIKIVTAKPKATIIPERAVLPTERGFIVYLVDDKKKVKSAKVKLGLRTTHGVEIVEGLSADQTIAVDGAAALRDGIEVEITKELK